MGNICRSPTAHGVFRKLVEDEGLTDVIEVDSAGTIHHHVGEAPDGRAQQAARKRGIDLSDLRARQVCAEDFAMFDYVIAMDHDNMSGLSALCAPEYAEKRHMFLDFAPARSEQEVPDPYYSGGFDHVFDLVEDASAGLLEDIKQRHI